MVNCHKCKKEIKLFFGRVLQGEKQNYALCRSCYKTVLSDGFYKAVDTNGHSECFKLKKPVSPEPYAHRNHEELISDQISNLEKPGGAVIALIVLGVIGLFIYVIPGIIFLIAAAIVRSSRNSQASALRLQLELTKKVSTVSKKPTNNSPMDILKRKLAEGTITEEEYVKKRDLLQK